jgi:hypothetical protein
MMNAAYYREQAARARRFAGSVANQPEITRQLHDVAQDFEEIAADLDSGAVGVRHPDLLSQKQRGG